MVQINVIGGILDSSGYSIHTRQLANALSKICDVKLTTQIPQQAVTLLTDKEVEMLKKPSKDEINLIITNPMYWKLNMNAKRNWVFFVFEGDRVPKSYLDECMNPDIEYIFVPSNHTKQALMHTAGEEWETLGDKVFVIPHGVDLNLFYSKEKPKDKFRFICNKGFRNLEDRGGIQYAIKAYLEEFSSKDNVELIVKINPVYGIPDLKKLINELTPSKPDLPNLRISVDNIPYNKLVDFYNQGHCLVAPSRAEAFNLACIEAMACGLPVITSSFGGQTDFCNDENGWIVNGELTEIKHELLYESVSWFTPSISELRKAMREAYFTWEKESFNKKIEKSLEKSKEFQWDKTSELVKSLI